MPDEPSKGQPTGWQPQTELEHFMQCPTCRAFFDMRKLDEVMEHTHGGKIEMIETFGPPTRRQ